MIKEEGRERQTLQQEERVGENESERDRERESERERQSEREGGGRDRRQNNVLPYHGANTFCDFS